MLRIPNLPFKVEEIGDENPIVREARRQRGRNEECWCQSNKKFKKCHLNRINLEPVQQREILAITHRIFWERKECSHPAAENGECSGQVINAHTIQRKGVLEKIAQSHHVFKLDTFLENPRKVEVKKVSWKKASTFPGFCSGHDSTMFQKIETEPFVGDHEQCVLQSYRSVCNEVYKKYGLLEALHYQKENIDRGMSIDEQISFQVSVNKSIENTKKSLKEIEAIKVRYEAAILNRNFDAFSSRCYFFEGDFGIVSSGIAHIEYTFDGAKLADIWDLSKDADSIAHSIMTTSKGGAFFFCWENSSETAPVFLNSFDEIPNDEKASVFIQYSFLQSENTYFSAAWWDGLSTQNQEHIKKLCAAHYYEGGSYDAVKGLSNWIIVSAG